MCLKNVETECPPAKVDIHITLHMIRIKTIILFTCIILLMSCKNRIIQENKNIMNLQLEAPIIIDIARDFNKKKEFKLSEIADDIEYVKLEKTTESLIGGGIPFWYITKEYIFVYNSNRLLQFSRKGNYIKQIGKYGRGPGEILSTRGLALNESNNTLYVISNFANKVLKYDIDTGEFLGDFPINNALGSAMLPKSFLIIAKDTFMALSHPVTQFTSDYVIFEIFNDNGNVLAQKKSSLFSIQNDDKNVKRIENGFTQVWFFNEHFRLFEDLNDTIYDIKNNHLEPVYLFNLNGYKGPFDLMTTNYVRSKINYIRLFGFWETSKFLLFRFYYNGNSYCAQYDKIRKEFHQLINTKDNSGKMYNDIDGGLSFWPLYSVDHLDNEWICYMDAIDFKQQLSNGWLMTSEAKYPDKKEKLINFVNNLAIDDNPVLIFLKLKEYHNCK